MPALEFLSLGVYREGALISDRGLRYVVGGLTVLIMLSFLAIWAWAWLPHHKHDFESLARLPMSDDEDAAP